MNERNDKKITSVQSVPTRKLLLRDVNNLVIYFNKDEDPERGRPKRKRSDEKATITVKTFVLIPG